ncbi:hypothetical protein ACOME3_007566 [Neoechinorhynchus agilis]
MGSPLSPVLAELYMRHWEESNLTKLRAIQFWCRYVDDTFIILDQDRCTAVQLQQELNEKDSHIQWTCEKEDCGFLPFLDVQVKRKYDNTFSTSVYIKQGVPHRIVSWISAQPHKYKLSSRSCGGFNVRKVTFPEKSSNRISSLLIIVLNNFSFQRR